jgi:hypothetical protein
MALAFLGVLAGCAVKQIPPTTPPLSTAVHAERLLQLPTRVIYESVDTDRELTEPPPEATARAARLDGELRGRLAARGLQLVALPELAPDVRAETDGVIAKVRPRYVRLIGASRDKSAFHDTLAELKRLTGAELACVPVLYVKVGKSGGYDPNSGAIWTTTSSTSLRVGIVSLTTGERVWFRESFMRSMANDRDLGRAIDVLFREE